MLDVENIPEHINLAESGPDYKRSLWAMAMGMQPMEDLRTSSYLDGLAEQHIDGQITIQEALAFVEMHYWVDDDYPMPEEPGEGKAGAASSTAGSANPHDQVGSPSANFTRPSSSGTPGPLDVPIAPNAGQASVSHVGAPGVHTTRTATENSRGVPGSYTNPSTADRSDSDQLFHPSPRSTNRVWTSEERADIVATRIVHTLMAGSFMYFPQYLRLLHAFLFEGFTEPPYDTQFRDFDDRRPERVLGGRSIEFASYGIIDDALKHDFAQFDYSGFSSGLHLEDAGQSLMRLIASIWQVHPFAQGNTITTVTFMMMLLKTWSVVVNPRVMAQHARYLRNALILVNSPDYRQGIAEGVGHLAAFCSNFYGGGHHMLIDDASGWGML